MERYVGEFTMDTAGLEAENFNTEVHCITTGTPVIIFIVISLLFITEQKTRKADYRYIWTSP
jgi:hypothetical protein